MSGLGRAVGYLGVTVAVVVMAFVVGVYTYDCDTGECDLGGLAGLVAAFWALGVCVLGVIVIECAGAWKRVRAKRGTP